VVGEGHWNGEIHADHADLYAIDEIAGRITISREDRNAVSILVFRWQPDGFLIVFCAHDRQNGSENLFLVDSHVRLDVIEQTAAHEIPVLVALQLEAAAIDDEFRAFLDALIDVIFHLVQMRPRHQRSIVGLRIVGRTDLQALDTRNEFFDEYVSRLFADGDGHRHGHATLTCGAVARPDERVHRLIHVGVRHYDHMILGPAEALYAFAIGATGCVDIFRNG